jgi:hypothetical protein
MLNLFKMYTSHQRQNGEVDRAPDVTFGKGREVLEDEAKKSSWDYVL